MRNKSLKLIILKLGPVVKQMSFKDISFQRPVVALLLG